MTRPRSPVIVMGSGAAGLAAAVSAARQGAHVTLLEAAPTLGGTTATSGGGIWVPANPWAAADGVEDSPERALRYLRRVAALNGDASLAEVYVEEAVRVLQALEETTPMRFQQINGFPDYNPELEGAMTAGGRVLETAPVQVSQEVLGLVRENPYNWPPITFDEGAQPPEVAELERRRRDGIVTRGRGMIAALYSTLLELGGDIRTRAKAEELLLEDGTVVGARVGGSELRGQVIVASGGFERNAELVRAFLPGPMTAPAAPPTNRGEMLLMSVMAGAALANMTDAWYVPAMHIPGETIDGAPFFRMLFSESAKPGGLLVDSNGRRFVNEAMAYYGLGRSLHRLDPESFSFPRAPSWFVMDAQRRALGTQGLGGDSPDPEWLARANSIEELAQSIGLPEAVFVDTVRGFNAQAAGGVDADFGRGEHLWDRFSSRVVVGGVTAAPLRPLTDPPYYAIEVLPGCQGTKGGLRTDGCGRVIRAGSDHFIPGLYAAGNAAAYPFGLGYPGPGAVLGPALVFGWIAGETAARSE